MNPILETTEMSGQWNISAMSWEKVNQSVNTFNEQQSVLENATTVASHTIEAWYILSWLVISPTLTIVGLFGNVLTFVIMTSKEFNNLNSRSFLLALAFSDSIFLMIQPFNRIAVIQFIGMDIRALSNVGCQIYFWFCKFSKITSSWIIVAICVERFIAVFFPFRVRVLCEKRTATIALLAIYLCIGTLNAMFTFSSHIKNGTCSPDVVTTETVLWYRGAVLAAVSIYCIIPITILLTLTPLIIYKLFNRPVQRTINNVMHSNRHLKERLRMTFTLVAIIVVYIVCVIPISFLHIDAHFLNIGVFTHDAMEFAILREIAQILELLNYSINFFLYVITSSQFRKRLCVIMGCRRCQES